MIRQEEGSAFAGSWDSCLMNHETEKRKKDMVLLKNCLFLSFYSKERCEETEMDKTIVYNGGKLKEKYSDIEKAIILPNVWEIRVEAFMNAKILKSAVIPDSVGMPISHIRL